MKESEKNILEPIFEEFIFLLNGRYREHCSDTFLKELLLLQCNKPCFGYMYAGQGLLDPENKHKEMLLHEISCPIFESILEHGCQAGGNGHHVAQKFAVFMEEKL